MFFVLAFTYSVCMAVKSLVLEKELGLKEVLRSTGVPNGALWCAWFTENMTLLLVPCLLLSVMLKVSTGGGGGRTSLSLSLSLLAGRGRAPGPQSTPARDGNAEEGREGGRRSLA